MSDERIARARSITSAGEAAAVYRDWAASYDDDVFGRLGFTGSARIAELLVAHLPDRSAPVLDLGCGTGAVGVRLAELGVTTIDGVDLSPEMLAIAERTGAYRTLSVADLTAGDLELDRGLRRDHLRGNVHERPRRSGCRAPSAARARAGWPDRLGDRRRHVALVRARAVGLGPRRAARRARSHPPGRRPRGRDVRRPLDLTAARLIDVVRIGGKRRNTRHRCL